MQNKMRRWLLAAMALSSVPVVAQPTPECQMEPLGRGVTALSGQSAGIFVSWRLLGTDAMNTSFDVLRDGKVVASNLRDRTCFQDNGGTSASTYQVVTRVGGEVTATTEGVQPWTDIYTSVQLDRPAAGSNYEYTPNDMAVGDVDGDGEYELFVKWDPSNSKDNANTGASGPCIIDCYRLDGTKLWRVSLGSNIRAGAHYTQFMVYDFDADGRAEMICKTAPGTKDGQGAYVSAAADDSAIRSTNNATSYASGGRILSGPEFLTVFDGLTGAARHTIWYNPNRAGNYGKADDYPGSSSFWGDTNGNRGDRHLAAVAHLDAGARTASGIFCRGYYTRAYVWAVDYSGGKLKHRWLHCSSSKTAYSVTDASLATTSYTNSKATSGSGSATMYGNGNHNLSIADVDGDGRDEIIWGSAACDDNGRLLYGVGFGHGDAMHLADLLPDRPGLEVYDVHEDKGTYAWDLHDARTGEVLLKGGPSGVDNGRGLAAQVSAAHRESFFSSAADNQTRSCLTGDVVSEYGPLINNFRIFWDGDLQEELLGDISRHNSPILEKWNGNGYSRMYPKRNTNLYDIGASMTINDTKGVPCLQADILGDWREEIVFYDGSDPSKINIFSTNIPTTHRVPTLMHDHVYRMGIAWQNVAYNQPPHLGYYLPDADFGYQEQLPEPEEVQTLLTLDFEEGDAASYWAFNNEGSYLVEPAAAGSTGRAASIKSTKDRGDYVKIDADLSDAKTYRLSMDLLPSVTQKTTQLAVLSQSSWDKWTNNYGMFWKTNSGQEHNAYLFNWSAGENSATAAINIDIDHWEGDAQWTFQSGTWYHLVLTVDTKKRTVDYVITPKASPSYVEAQGTYKLPEGESAIVKGIYERGGRAAYDPGAIAIDNVVVDVPVEKPKTGDVNGDGIASVTDVTTTINYILGRKTSDFSEDEADMDGNGIVNVTDVTLIINAILGK